MHLGSLQNRFFNPDPAKGKFITRTWRSAIGKTPAKPRNPSKELRLIETAEQFDHSLVALKTKSCARIKFLVGFQSEWLLSSK